jgi:molybdenum cofactor guanylyltransferase
MGGLQTWRGTPLALHALRRLAPQTGPLLVSANRHLERYAQFGAKVVSDAPGPSAGPLAGLLAGLTACRTPWLAAVPCDAPCFPLDLVQRLGLAAQQSGGQAAVATTRENTMGAANWQPVFCLVHRALTPALAAWLQGGGRKATQWFSVQHAASALYEGEAAHRAFMNLNTLEDLTWAASS